jgi:mono/diheme cytochrome c family protein/plastocyanin
MTDQSGREPEQRLPVPRPEAQPPAPVERFTSPPATRQLELSPERAAQIVRQSSNARWVGFLAVVVVVLFVALYWFYELGAPLGITPSRLEAEVGAQQVTEVTRGYNIYQANCARCHGVNGEGGVGPKLNRQDKLFTHLNENYLHNILEVGGRYACGDPLSAMPVWADTGNPPGPLNYVQIEELVAFLRATNDHEYIIRDPELYEPVIDPITGEPETFRPWRDPNYQPEPGATPYPDCWKQEFASPSAAPSGSPGASAAPSASAGASAAPSAPTGSAAPSGPTGSAAPPASPAAAAVSIKAEAIAFIPTELTVPADTPFTLEFVNNDAGVPHDVEIRDAAGQSLFKTDTFQGVETRSYEAPALPPGSYPFVCTVHANMTGTLTAE